MDREQYTVEDTHVHEEVKRDANKDLIRQIAAILVALSGFLGVLGYQFEWLTEESINSFIVLLYAVAGFGYTAYEIYKNHFAGKRARKQNEVLKKEGLK